MSILVDVFWWNKFSSGNSSSAANRTSGMLSALSRTTFNLKALSRALGSQMEYKISLGAERRGQANCSRGSHSRGRDFITGALHSQCVSTPHFLSMHRQCNFGSKIFQVTLERAERTKHKKKRIISREWAQAKIVSNFPRVYNLIPSFVLNSVLSSRHGSADTIWKRLLAELKFIPLPAGTAKKC